jgi:prepilin-type N-terminal cleavage/methylation domain-containing protein
MQYSIPSKSRSRRAGFTLIELLTVISIIGILAGILIPVVSVAIKTAKRQKTYAMLNNIVAMCQMYKQEYKFYPALQTGTPTNNALELKSMSNFVPIMTGNFTSSTSADLQYNKRIVPFATFSNDELSTDGTHIQDAFGNDDIIIFLDYENTGSIPANDITSQTMTAGNTNDGYNSNEITISQTVPVHSPIIAMSPGAGLSNSDAVTTWDPQ